MRGDKPAEEAGERLRMEGMHREQRWEGESLQLRLGGPWGGFPSASGSGSVSFCVLPTPFFLKIFHLFLKSSWGICCVPSLALSTAQGAVNRTDISLVLRISSQIQRSQVAQPLWQAGALDQNRRDSGK